MGAMFREILVAMIDQKVEVHTGGQTPFIGYVLGTIHFVGPDYVEVILLGVDDTSAFVPLAAIQRVVQRSK